MESSPKKKHHKHHREDTGISDENKEHGEDAGISDEKKETKESKKKHKHHKHLKEKEIFKEELIALDNKASNNFLPDILSNFKSARKDKGEGRFSSSASSQSKRQSIAQSKNNLNVLSEKRGSEGKITKAKKRKSSFGLDPIINRIQLKKPPVREVSIVSPMSSPPTSDIQIQLSGANVVDTTNINMTNVSVPMPTKRRTTMRSSASNLSEGSRGGNGTPDEENYDTEELRILNHEKMVYLINKKANPIVKRWKKWIASMDTFAARHPTVFHNLCIKISVAMVPILLISLIWDSCAGFILEIPHYSMINFPGFMLVFHFIALPTALYGYMMRSLMGKSRTCLSRLAVIAIFIHPILLAYRCYLEWEFNNFRDEEKLHYEWYTHHHNHDQKAHSHSIFEFYK